MIKMLNLLKQIIYDSFLYKKRLVLSVLGILISTVILNVGMILVNYQTCKNSILVEYPQNTGVYNGVIDYFPSEYVDGELVYVVEEKVTNKIVEDVNITFSLYGVKENFLNYPVTNVNNDNYLSSTEFLYGEEMTEYDVLCGNRYVYLEESYCSLLFKDNPLGKMVEIGKVGYIVKGVLKDTASTKRYLSHVKDNELVVRGYTTYSSIEKFFPYTYYSRYIFIYENKLDLSSIFYPSSYYSYDDAQKELKKEKNELIDDLKPIFIVTLMAMSVLETIIVVFNLKERGPEIGIKRAIGASRDEICFEFILEIVIVGIIGIICGIVISLLTNFIIMLQYKSIYYLVVSFLSIGEIFLTSAFLFGIIVLSSLLPIAYIANVNIVDVVKGE